MAKTPLRDDPTRTRTLRDRSVQNINARYGKIKKLINDSIITNKIFATNAQPLTPDQFLFLREGQKVTAFMDWLQLAINEIIIEIPVNNPTYTQMQNQWLISYINDGYVRGAQSGNTDISVVLGRQQVPPVPTSVVFLPAHFQASELLFTRAFTQLKGINATMSQQIAEELTRGLLEGRNPIDIAKSLTDRVDKIGISRSRLLSRTEIINAWNTASIIEGNRLGELLGEENYHRWITSRDDRVRETHATRDRKVYTTERVSQLIGEPNCRCAIQNVFESMLNDDTIIVGK